MKLVESQYVELKEKVNEDFVKEVIAFANTNGGEIYVGVANDGTIVGIDDPEKEMERISNLIRDGIKPDLMAYTEITCIVEANVSIIKVTVSQGLKRPYHLTKKGLKPSGVYMRHGVSSVPVSDEMIRQMIKESDGTVFDKMRSVNQDLTFHYAKDYFNTVNLPFEKNQQRTLKLIDEDGYYTNAAWLLSDQCAHIIRCAVYEGSGKTTFKTRREFSGSILKQMDDAYAFLELNNNLSSNFEGLRRVDHPDYPAYALREALINAIVHRDYDYSGSIIINIYDDRMEFVSIGGLVKGITMADILQGISQSRNMVIAEIFYRLELIESYGTGIQRIRESYSGHYAQPTFTAAPTSFVVTLPNLNYHVKEDVSIVDQSEISVLNLFMEKPYIVRVDVEKALHCSSFKASKILTALLKNGKIIKTGTARATKYYLK